MTRGSQLRSQIAEAQTRIADLEHQLATLRAQETRFKTELQAIVYPILTIPAEITAEILCQAAADSVTKWLLAATSVCRLWRNIALATPRLWNEFHSTPWLAERYRDPVSLLNLWISRSGILPLYITVSVSRDAKHRLGALMAKHISRWRRVDLTGERCYHEVLENLPEPSLVVDDVDDGDDHLDCAAQLREFLDDLGAGNVLGAVEQMTLLCIPYCISPALRQALEDKVHLPSSRLKKLTLEFNQYDEPPGRWSHMLVLKDVEMEVMYYR
ncbi:hypothetical protein C8F01DRAFT_1376737 [Mycena amicta]|nr:hypothetical protein C8F01DRAFT_1376737 [Mycena amicta]